MPTFLNSFTDSEIKVRFKEPYLTAGIDQKVARVQPRGVYRGFLLTPSGLNLTVTVQAEVASGQHVSVYETADGYSLRIARAADFDLDLSTPALLGKTVVLAVYADYVLNVDTRAEIRAYELSPVDEFTVAPERSELVVLGTVVVPGAGLITDIDSSYRTMAWEDGAPEARDWVQFIENGGFEIAHVNTITPAGGSVDVAEMAPGWDTFTSIGMTRTGGVIVSVTNTQQHTGRNSLGIQMSGLANQGMWLRYAGTAQVRPGQRVKGSIWVKGVLLNPGPTAAPGVLGLVLEFFRTDGVLISVAEIGNPALTGSFGWTELSDIVTVPALSATMYAFVMYNDDNHNSTGDLYFDDVRVWLESDPPSQDSIRQEELNQGSKRLEVLDILPAPTAPMLNLATAIGRAIRLRGSGYSGGITNLVMSCRDHLTEFALRLLHGDLRVDKALLGLGLDLIGSSSNGAKPRIQAPVPVATTARYVLLYEADNQVANGPCVRIYATESSALGTSGARLVLTVNARWTGTQWEFDDSGSSASRFDLAEEEFYFHVRHLLTASPWNDADWNTGTTSRKYFQSGRGPGSGGETAVTGDAVVEDRLYVGDGILASAADAAKGRVQASHADVAVGRYTCIFESLSLGADDASVRVYITPDSSVGATPYKTCLTITFNAKWNGTQWQRDSVTYESHRLDIGATAPALLGGVAWYKYPTASASPWNDTTWDAVPGYKLVELAIAAPLNYYAKAKFYDGTVEFTSSGSETNPNVGASAPTPNQLCALNTPRAWAKILTKSGSDAVLDGYNIDTTLAYSLGAIEVTLKTPLNPPDVPKIDYCVVVTGLNSSPRIYTVTQVSASVFRVWAFDHAGAQIMLNTDAEMFSVVVFGRQDS
jgi:hypothetical protein